MQQKHLNYIIAGCVSLIVVLVLSLNVMAAYDSNTDESKTAGQLPFETDKSDRTMLKEIIVNQGKTHALLKEIKTLLQEKK